MKNSLIVDTGCWYALLAQKDRHHTRVRVFFERCNHHLITTWPVMTETCYLLQRDLGVTAAADFMRMAARGAFHLHEFSSQRLQRCAELTLQYADLPMDLADASLVMLAEDLGHGDIISTDQRDFHSYRWKNHHPFRNLLFP